MSDPVAPANSASPTPASVKRHPWYVRPAVVLPAVSVLIIASALIAPEQTSGRSGDARLTTYSTQPQGASVVFELARRLGWRVEQRLAQSIDTTSDVINAVLDPVVALRASEAHALLEQVRHGGALLLVIDDGKSELADSLHVESGKRNGYVVPNPSARASCEIETRMARLQSLWPDNEAHLFAMAWTSTRETPVDTMLRVQDSPFRDTGTPRLPAVMGMSLGAGRVVIASDPDFLRNDALRVCRFALDIVLVHALEFLRDGGPLPRQRLVFDEYHQRNSHQPGTVATVTAFLSSTQSGHVLFQLLGAGLVLLIALAPRAIPPRDRDHVERRSPLEQVDALARAYEQVGGTRTAASLLVRGLRRRLERGGARAVDPARDERFLERIEEAHPSLRADIAQLRRALATSLTPQEFAQLGPAIQRIEQSLAHL